MFKKYAFRSAKALIGKNIFLGEGYNYLMPHLLSAMLRGQVERQKQIFKEKIRVGKIYRKVFKDQFIFSQIPPKNFHSVHWLNSLILEDLTINEVKKVGEKLIQKGIEVRSGFWPLINTQNVKKVYVGNEKIGIKSYNKI